jgi:UDP-glucose 4-epimerase
MRILATGGAGYVGSAAVRLLISQGHEVIVFDNLSKGHSQSIPAECLVVGDLSDRESLVRTLQENRTEAVMHFAASIAVGESVADPRGYYRNNIGNSLNLLDAMLDTGVKKILFSSTAAVYAPQNDMLNEDSPKSPASPYAFSKYAIERLIQDFSSAYGLGYVILRYFNASGADPTGRYGENHHPETHLIPLVLQVPLGRRNKISIFGNDYDTPDGTCIRDYVHVDDLADAHTRAIVKIEAGQGNIYNIGTGTGHSVLEVIRTAENVVGGKIAYETLERRWGDTARLVAGAEKLKRELGWRPRYTQLSDIVAGAWNWHRLHPDGYGSTATPAGGDCCRCRKAATKQS